MKAFQRLLIITTPILATTLIGCEASENQRLRPRLFLDLGGRGFLGWLGFVVAGEGGLRRSVGVLEVGAQPADDAS